MQALIEDIKRLIISTLNLEDVAPEDIESIDVLKDGSAAD